jgi:anti-sigma factor RsiW
MSHGMACASGVQLLMEYLEGTLPPDLQEDIERHVSSCERCTAFVASYRETPRIVREVTAAGMPRELEDSLMEFLRARRR